MCLWATLLTWCKLAGTFSELDITDTLSPPAMISLRCLPVNVAR